MMSKICPKYGGRSRGYTFINLYNEYAHIYFKESFNVQGKIIWQPDSTV